MITTTSTALAEILDLARAAAAAGDTTRARHDFRNLTEIAPTLTEAWLGYAACTAVLKERHALFARALELDPASIEAREGMAHAEALLAVGKLVLPNERAVSIEPLVVPAAAPPAPLMQGARGGLGALLAVGLIGLATMGVLTACGIFVLTSFWGFMLAFLAGPAVSELVMRLSARPRKAARGRPLQLAAGAGMFLGGLAAMALGGLLLQLLGVPVPAEAVQMARNIGVATDGATVLLNNPGLLVFLSSAVAATVYRLR
jgi:hypothetical protein